MGIPIQVVEQTGASISKSTPVAFPQI